MDITYEKICCLSKNLDAIRYIFGWTILGLSDTLGISTSTLYAIHRNKQMSKTLYLAIMYLIVSEFAEADDRTRKIVARLLDTDVPDADKEYIKNDIFTTVKRIGKGAPMKDVCAAIHESEIFRPINNRYVSNGGINQ